MVDNHLVNKAELFFRRRGLKVVKTDQKGRPRPDLLIYKFDQAEDKKAEVVVEIKAQPTREAQQQLMKYVQDYEAEYALLVTEENFYWFDGETFLPVDQPEFLVQQKFLFEHEPIKNVLFIVSESLRGNFSRKQIGQIMIQVLLVRAYLDESDKFDQWWDIRTEDQFLTLIEEAINYYQLNVRPIQYGLSDEYIHLYIKELGALPPRDIVLAETFYDIFQQEYPENLTTETIREVFAKFTRELNFAKEKVVDLTAGLGMTAFAVMEANQFRQLTSFEINEQTTTLMQMLAIISNYSVQAICADSLQPHEQLQHNSYSLTLLTPPFGYRYKLTDKQKDMYNLAKHRPPRDAADLFMERAIQVTERGGYIVALVPETILFSKASQLTREFIKEQTIIEAIISLPAHALKPFAMVRASLLVLRKRTDVDETAENLFISATESIEDIKKIAEGFSLWKKGVNNFA